MTSRNAAHASRGYRALSSRWSQAGKLLVVMLFGFSIPAGHALAWQAPVAEPAVEQGSGAYPATFEEDTTLPAHVVYRPRDSRGQGALIAGTPD